MSPSHARRPARTERPHHRPRGPRRPARRVRSGSPGSCPKTSGDFVIERQRADRNRSTGRGAEDVADVGWTGSPVQSRQVHVHGSLVGAYRSRRRPDRDVAQRPGSLALEFVADLDHRRHLAEGVGRSWAAVGNRRVRGPRDVHGGAALLRLGSRRGGRQQRRRPRPARLSRPWPASPISSCWACRSARQTSQKLRHWSRRYRYRAPSRVQVPLTARCPSDRGCSGAAAPDPLGASPRRTRSRSRAQPR